MSTVSEQTEQLLSSTEVCEAASVSYRRLDYWVRAGLVSPTVPARGSGTGRRFTAKDLARVIDVRDAFDEAERVLARVGARMGPQTQLAGRARPRSRVAEGLTRW